MTEFQSSTAAGVVPNSLRLFWFIASVVSLGFGLFFVISSGTHHGEDFAIAIAAGVDALILSAFFFIGACRSRFDGWFRYLIKPAIMLVCVLTIVASSIYMGNVGLDQEAYNVSLFMIIFPALVFIITFK